MSNTKAVGVAFADPLVENVQFEAFTVGQLPGASAELLGTRSVVSNATVTLTLGIGTVVAGGGSNVVPVFCDGSAWRIG
jgi:hypothetical protein